METSKQAGLEIRPATPCEAEAFAAPAGAGPSLPATSSSPVSLSMSLQGGAVREALKQCLF